MTTPLASPGRVELVIFSYSGEPLRYLLPVVGQVRIGRDPTSNDIVIGDGTVSSKHAILTVDSRITIRDLGSLNGTILRRREIDMDITHTEQAHRSSGDSFVVEPGDRLLFGSTMTVIRRMPLRSNGNAGGGGTWSYAPVVRHPAMQSLYVEARRVAAASPRACVLLLGETGVGKDVLARAMHAASPRSKGPFVAVNCPAIGGLFENAMCGHVRGAFTDAKFDTKGYFEAADGGTLFLDEIGELSLEMQVKLLRIVEERCVTRVGSTESRYVNVRIIAATNRPLAQCVAQGTFRRDLYHRLRGFVLEIPPLRSRPTDIIPLAEAFLEEECRLMEEKVVPRLSSEVIALLEGYEFPGNVRELRNAMMNAAVRCMGDVVLPEHLLEEIWDPDKTDPMVATRFVVAEQLPEGASDEEQIRWALHKTCNNVTRAAELLGKSRRWLNYKLDEYNIGRSRKSRTGTVVGGSDSRQTA